MSGAKFDGTEDVFGPDYGGAAGDVRAGYREECPNIGVETLDGAPGLPWFAVSGHIWPRVAMVGH